jgi:hypothetical protein
MSIADEHAGAGRNRSGSSVRQRQAQVGVRLTDEEYAALKAAADNCGLTPATVLRLAFMRDLEHCGCWCSSAVEYTVSGVPAEAYPATIQPSLWERSAGHHAERYRHSRQGDSAPESHRRPPMEISPDWTGLNGWDPSC